MMAAHPGRVLRSTFWSTASVAISAATGILTARGLGPESRGTLALVISVAGLCVLLSAVGSNVSIRRHLPLREGVTVSGYERLSLILLVPLSIILVAVAYTMAVFVDPSFGNIHIGVAFMGFGLGWHFSNQSLDLLNAHGLVTESSRTSAFGSLFCLILVATSTLLGWGLVAIIWCYALSAVFQFGVAYAILIRKNLREQDRALGMRILVRDGSRLLGLNLGQSLAYRADTIMLGVLSTQTQVGQYAVAITPASILRLPANALGQASFHEAASGAITGWGLVRRMARLFAFVLPAAVVGWLAADLLFTLIYGKEYSEAADAFRILLVAELALTPFLVLGRTVAGLGSTWGASAAGLAGVACLLTSGAFLIPAWGATGAAWSSVIAYGAMSGVAILVFWHQLSSRQSRLGGAAEAD